MTVRRTTDGIDCPALTCDHEWERLPGQGVIGLDGLVDWGCKKGCGAFRAARPVVNDSYEATDVADRPFVIRRR